MSQKQFFIRPFNLVNQWLEKYPEKVSFLELRSSKLYFTVFGKIVIVDHRLPF